MKYSHSHRVCRVAFRKSKYLYCILSARVDVKQRQISQKHFFTKQATLRRNVTFIQDHTPLWILIRVHSICPFNGEKMNNELQFDSLIIELNVYRILGKSPWGCKVIKARALATSSEATQMICLAQYNMEFTHLPVKYSLSVTESQVNRWNVAQLSKDPPVTDLVYARTMLKSFDQTGWIHKGFCGFAELLVCVWMLVTYQICSFAYFQVAWPFSRHWKMFP